MIDFSGYTREVIQKEMLDQVDPNIDTREGSMIQTAIGPAAWYLEGVYMILKQIQDNARRQREEDAVRLNAIKQDFERMLSAPGAGQGGANR